MIAALDTDSAPAEQPSEQDSFSGSQKCWLVLSTCARLVDLSGVVTAAIVCDIIAERFRGWLALSCSAPNTASFTVTWTLYFDVPDPFWFSSTDTVVSADAVVGEDISAGAFKLPSALSFEFAGPWLSSFSGEAAAAAANAAATDAAAEAAAACSTSAIAAGDQPSRACPAPAALGDVTAISFVGVCSWQSDVCVLSLSSATVISALKCCLSLTLSAVAG